MLSSNWVVVISNVVRVGLSIVLFIVSISIVHATFVIVVTHGIYWLIIRLLFPIDSVAMLLSIGVIKLLAIVVAPLIGLLMVIAVVVA